MNRKPTLAAALAGSIVTLVFLAASQGARAVLLTPAPCDFVTGGGSVVTDDGNVAEFGVHAGCKNGSFWGHINYEDLASGLHLRSVQITGYGWDPADPGTRDFCGWGRINNQPDLVQFRVTVTDNGNANDTFGIAIDGLHDVLGTRFYIAHERFTAEGNVQLHAGNNSNSSPGTFTETQQCADLTGANAP